jgi:hypothetical protein
MCNYFWGSHGCHRPMDDHTVHQCGLDDDEEGPCSQYDEPERRVRYALRDEDETSYEWSEWMETGKGWRQ